jgi:arabinogalactan oligomer/maltooligosaccharide transport system permease protein
MESSKGTIAVEKDEASIVDRLEPLPRSKWMAQGLWGFTKSLLLKLADALWTVVYALYSVVLGFFRFLYHFAFGLVHWFQNLFFKFRFNDWSGRLSFLIFGSSAIKNKQIVKGCLYFVFEVSYLVLFGLFGLNSLRGLSLDANLAYTEVCTYDPDLEYNSCVKDLTKNMVLILVYGLLWLFSFALFFFVWKKSIDNGYDNFRIRDYQKFAKTIDTVRPYSLEIDQDLEENKFSDYSFRELKHRYQAVYDQVKPLFSQKIEAGYADSILDNTIRSNLSHHKKIAFLEKKVDKCGEKIAVLQDNPEYGAQLKSMEEQLSQEQAKLDEMSQVYWAKKDDIKIHPFVAGSPEENEFKELQKKRNAQRNLTLSLGDKAVAFKGRHDRKINKLIAARSKAQNEISEEKKHYLAFVEQESVKNSASYGRFNVYYRQIGDYATQKAFFTHYEETVKAYDEGLRTFEKANADNTAAKSKLKADYEEKVKAIHANYDAIFAKRAEVEGRTKTEKEAYEAKAAEIKQTIPDDQQKDALTQAKFAYKDHLKTIGGILDGLPTVKQIKAMEKEELDNVTHSFKRDTKSLKTDYTSEEYGDFCAINSMILKSEVSYETALALMKDVKAHYSAEEVADHLSKVSAKADEYSRKNPTKFDGRPKSFKEDWHSLLDENFHITLLFLPIAGCVIFVVMPLLFSILIAFTNYSQGHVPPTQTFTWIGWQNFVTLFNPDPNSIYAGLSLGLGKSLVWTLVWAVLATFSNYYLGIIFALMINRDGIKLKKMWRTIFVMSIAVPQFISLIGISLLLKDTGAFGQLWHTWFGTRLGFGSDKTNGALTTKIIIILVNIWVGVPYTILSTTGILLNIPKDLYESSEIDGAGRSTQFWSITMPYIRFVLGPSLIQTFIGNINNFGVIFFLTGGGPDYITELSLGHTDLLITFLYKMVTSANNPQFGLASTIGILVFLICAFFSLIMYNKSDAVTKEDQFQ